MYSSDPKLFSDAILIPKLAYREAIEMSYYGAKVIHPKTIKPLENKGIPLYVRPFMDIEANGTCISNIVVDDYPPIIVTEQNQILLKISSTDLSFVAENHLALLFAWFEKYRVKINIMKNTAISFVICFKYDGYRTEECIKKITSEFDVTRFSDLELLTIRHFDNDTLTRLIKGREILFKEVYGSTIQMVMETDSCT